MKKFALFENSYKPESVAYAEMAAQKLYKLEIECYAKPELIALMKPEIARNIRPCPIEDYGKFTDIVICFGGDGTMLHAARQMVNSDVPIMGVNAGKLGFLAEFSIDDLDKSIHDLLNGNYRVVDRSVIETNINGEKIYALNDFVIEKKDSSRMITIRTFSNEHHVADYRADGIICTTPTGSTAYSLSCGGPIIAPSTRVLCLTPISPHSLTLRPLVIPDTNEISLQVNSPTGEVHFVADGQIRRTLKNNEQVIFKRSDFVIKLIKPTNSSWYDLLRKKFLWAANPVAFETGEK